MKLHIKNMVCNRCIMVVDQQLKDLDMPAISVALGEVDFGDLELTAGQVGKIKDSLAPLGFELLDSLVYTVGDHIELCEVHVRDRYVIVELDCLPE